MRCIMRYEKFCELLREHAMKITVVCLHDILLERRDDVSRGCNKGASSVRLHDVSNKSQIKHLTTSQ